MGVTGARVWKVYDEGGFSKNIKKFTSTHISIRKCASGKM